MSEKQKKISYISIFILIIISFITVSIFLLNRNNIDNLTFNVPPVKLYDYDKDALDAQKNGDDVVDEETGVSGLNDLKDYISGYNIALSETKELEEYFGINIVYFLVNYSTASLKANVTIGIQSEENISDKTMKSFIDWIEKHPKAFIGNNPLIYEGLNIEVMKEYKYEVNMDNYQDSNLRTESYLTDENVIQFIETSISKKDIISTSILRKSVENVPYELDYTIQNSYLNTNNTAMTVELVVDKKDYEKLSEDELIQFMQDYHKMTHSINNTDKQAYTNTDISLLDKDTQQLLANVSEQQSIYLLNSFINK